jgi:hypothetical protein
VGRGARPYKKVSVTLPADLLDEIRERVGPGNLSRYLTEAAEQKRRHEALDEWIARMEDEHGPIPEHAVEEAERRWTGKGNAR